MNENKIARNLHPMRSCSAISKFLTITPIVLLFACGEVKRHDPSIIQMDTDGKLFAFTISDGELRTELYYSDVTGVLIKPLPNSEKNRSSVHVGRKAVYFTEYDQKQKSTELRKCDKQFKNCQFLTSMTGNIRNPVELPTGSLLFQRAPYKSATHSNSGYTAFRFYIIKNGGLSAKIQATPRFAANGPVQLIGNRLYFSGIAPRKQRPQITPGLTRFRSDWIADIKNDAVTNMRSEDLQLGGDFNLISRYIYGSKAVYYLGLNSSGYVYQTCILEIDEKQLCLNNGVKTSHSVPEGKKIYFGILDYKSKKVKIKLVDSGMKSAFNQQFD